MVRANSLKTTLLNTEKRSGDTCRSPEHVAILKVYFKIHLHSKYKLHYPKLPVHLKNCVATRKYLMAPNGRPPTTVFWDITVRKKKKNMHTTEPLFGRSVHLPHAHPRTSVSPQISTLNVWLAPAVVERLPRMFHAFSGRVAGGCPCACFGLHGGKSRDCEFDGYIRIRTRACPRRCRRDPSAHGGARESGSCQFVIRLLS